MMGEMMGGMRQDDERERRDDGRDDGQGRRNDGQDEAR
jgi:hypothetical protein